MSPATASMSSAAITILEAIKELQKARDFTRTGAVSLPEALRKSSIMAKVLVTESLEQEPIMIPLLTVINRLYTCYAVTAMGYNQFINKAQTVGDLLKSVATESVSLTDELNALCVNITDDSTMGLLQNSASEKITKLETKIGNEAVRTLDLDGKNASLISGRVVEIELSTDKKTNATILLFIQLYPVIISDQVAEAFLEGHFELNNEIRKLQRRAGEIRWIRDYYMQEDITERKAKALAQDDSNMLEALYKMNNNQLRRKLNKERSIDNATRKRNENIANSVMIITSEQYQAIEAQHNKALSDPRKRKDFFNKSLCMILVVVNIPYRNVEIFYHGIDMSTRTDFIALEHNAKEHGKYDIKELMAIMSQTNAPQI